MTYSYQVLVVGEYFVDVIFTGLPGQPDPGREVVSTGFGWIPGGAYNTAVTLRRLGVNAGWAADFGTDDFSQWVIAKCIEEGLDDHIFVRHNRPLRSITVSLSYPTDRAFITYVDPSPKIPAGFKALPTISADLVFIPGMYTGKLFDAGLALLRARKTAVFMDGNSTESVTLNQPGVEKALHAVDCYLPNSDEARRMIGEDDLEKVLIRLGKICPLVVVKDGSQGAFACHLGRIIHVPAIDIQALDTTGAGDCFDAGFIKAWLDRRPLEECLRWGNIVGGLSATEIGGTAHKTTENEIIKWLKFYDEKKSTG